LARFNFTSDDVARTRFGPAAAPVMETMLTMAELRGLAAAPARHRADPWLRQAQAAFPATARPLLDLLLPCLPWPDFLDSFAPDLKEGLDEVRATPRSALRAQLAHTWRYRAGNPNPPTWVRNLAEGDRESVELVVRAVRDLHRAIVEPRWGGAVLGFHADVARRIPMLAAGGHERLFDTIHPRLRWRDNGLDRAGFDGEWDLGGLGLLLMPSAFWTGEPLFSLSDDPLRWRLADGAARGRRRRRPPGGAARPDPGGGAAGAGGPARHGRAGGPGRDQPGQRLRARQGAAGRGPDRDRPRGPAGPALADPARPDNARPAADRARRAGRAGGQVKSTVTFLTPAAPSTRASIALVLCSPAVSSAWSCTAAAWIWLSASRYSGR
jgi:hypothetical protein